MLHNHTRASARISTYVAGVILRDLVSQAMFEGQPYIAAGAKFSCVGTDNTISPLYLRLLGPAHFESDANTITAAVRVAHFAEMIYGHAHIEQNMQDPLVTIGITPLFNLFHPAQPTLLFVHLL